MHCLLIDFGFLAILLGYFLFALVVLRASFSKSQLHCGLLLLSLVVAQFCLKVIDRFYLPAYLSRAGDERDWLRFLSLYEPGRKIPYQGTLEGPGIYYLVSFVASLFRIDYASALTGLAILLGSLYLVPTFMMYRLLLKGNARLALTGTLLLSLTDVMVYSTTTARPTLFGFFLMPITVVAFQSLRGRFRPLTFIVLVSSSLATLVMHAPITYLVLLSLVSSTVLIFDKVRKWEVAYTLFLFSSYGLALLFLPFLDHVWIGLLTVPLNLLPAFMNVSFFLIFPIIGVVILALSRVLRRVVVSIHKRANKISAKHTKAATYVVLCLISLAFMAFSILTVQKYALFIRSYYGNVGVFLLLHGWKIPFAIVALIGIKAIDTRYRRTSNDSTVSWLLGIALLVLASTIIVAPLKDPGLWNLDERFMEFAYFPAIYFVTLGLKRLGDRLPTRTFRWALLPLMASYVIPSIIVGTRMLSIFKP